MRAKIAEWLLATAKLADRQEKQQQRIDELEGRVRTLEERLRMLGNDFLHAREMEAAERANLLLRLENAVQSARLALPKTKPRSGKKP
jgi:membrane protein involved in colicin uptake